MEKRCRNKIVIINHPVVSCYQDDVIYCLQVMVVVTPALETKC